MERERLLSTETGVSRRSSHPAPRVLRLVFVEGLDGLGHIFVIDMTIRDWAAIQRLGGTGEGSLVLPQRVGLHSGNSNECFCPLNSQNILRKEATRSNVTPLALYPRHYLVTRP